MPNIMFTQYLRPDGRKQNIWIDRPEAIYNYAKMIIEAGYTLECEMLNVPDPLPNVSLTINGKHGDVAIELCRNGEAVPAAIDKLIMEFAQALERDKIADGDSDEAEDHRNDDDEAPGL